MTKQRDLKALVRERMAKTGESYQTAKRAVEAQRPVGPADDVNYLRGKATLLNEQAALLEQLEAASQRCQTEYGECVLPKGHRSEEHGDDHQRADGTWWNVGRALSPAEDHMVSELLKTAAEGPTTPIVEPKPLTAAEWEAQAKAQWEKEGVPKPKTFVVSPEELERVRRAILSCTACGTPLKEGDVGFCAPCKAKLEARIEYHYTSAVPGDENLSAMHVPNPKAERTLTVDVGDLPPEKVEAFIQRLKAQWRRLKDVQGYSEAQAAEFDKQAEEMALAAAERLLPQYRTELEFMDEVKRAVRETRLPEIRPEGPAPAQLTRRDGLSDEEKKALDDAMAKQPPCTCHVQPEQCRFHHPPVVESSGLPTSSPRDDVSITSREGSEGRTDFWLTRGGQDVYRLGYKDRNGKTVLGNEGTCTCERRDGMDRTCQFHHPPPETIDVAQKLRDRVYQEHVERIQKGEPLMVPITVNGQPHTVERRVPYEVICVLAKLNLKLNPSVTYRGKRLLKPWETGRKFNDPVTPEPDWVRVEGSLSPGRAVDAEPGMVFNAVYTGNA